MIDAIIAEMASQFRKGVFAERTSFLFNVDDVTMTVIVDAQSYSVAKGATVAKADCSCKTTAEMFKRIWFEGYKPGIMDFLSGAIESDAPLLLPQFLKAFSK